MRYRKEIITTIGTLGCAMGIGFFMQQDSTTPAPADFSGATLANADASVLEVEDIILTAAEVAEVGGAPVAPPAEEVVTLAAAPEFIAPAPSEPPVIQTAAAVVDAPEPPLQAAPAPACDINASARPVAAAMVNLTMAASCLPNERVTVHHAGLLFNEVTDASGALDITVPAFASEAVFVVAFTNGEGAVAQTTVEELGDYDRVALQWKGETGFELHAREFGADYGSDGHVWSGEMRDISYGVTGRGGFISRLGNESVPDGLLAEVYTYPTNASQTAGRVYISAEAEVIAANCGTEIEAQTLQTSRGLDITTRDLTLSVPDCDAAGNFLVLNNLFTDLKVAAK